MLIIWGLLSIIGIVGAFVCNILENAYAFSGKNIYRISNAVGAIFCILSIVSMLGVLICLSFG